MGNDSSSDATEDKTSAKNNIVLKNKLKPYLNVCNDVKHAMLSGSRARISEDSYCKGSRFRSLVSASFLLSWIDENNLKPEITQIQDLSVVGSICVQMQVWVQIWFRNSDRWQFFVSEFCDLTRSFTILEKQNDQNFSCDWGCRLCDQTISYFHTQRNIPYEICQAL